MFPDLKELLALIEVPNFQEPIKLPLDNLKYIFLGLFGSPLRL
jgi:hypothetical protein